MILRTFNISLGDNKTFQKLVLDWIALWLSGITISVGVYNEVISMANRIYHRWHVNTLWLHLHNGIIVIDGHRPLTGFMASVLHRFCFLAVHHLHRRVLWWLLGRWPTNICSLGIWIRYLEEKRGNLSLCVPIEWSNGYVALFVFAWSHRQTNTA